MFICLVETSLDFGADNRILFRVFHRIDILPKRLDFEASIPTLNR